jgi:mycothiol synthase
VAIRPLTKDDDAGLERQVERARAAGEFAASSDATGSFFMKMVRHMSQPVAGAFDAHGGLLGFISPEVKIVAVEPEHRRRGIGRRLVEAGLGIERERGRPEILMGVRPDDPDGKAFLDATGFAFHSTLWDLALPPEVEVADPAWPAGIVARGFDRTRDVHPWVDLFNAAFADHATPLQMDTATVEAANADPSVSDDDLLVLGDLASGELVGFCATQPERVDGAIGPDGEIWTIGVRPDRQGRGLGRQLLRWGIGRLRSIGVRHVALSVNGRNEGALGLYLSEGFERGRTRERWARPVG